LEKVKILEDNWNVKKSKQKTWRTLSRKHEKKVPKVKNQEKQDKKRENLRFPLPTCHW
jgi:predicted ATP-grasp superfamily ATP-dependent carboligase